MTQSGYRLPVRQAKPTVMRILVVEDNATNQLVIRSILEKHGLKPDFASNGLEAIDSVRLRPYDVILMDFVMYVQPHVSTTPYAYAYAYACCSRVALSPRAAGR